MGNDAMVALGQATVDGCTLFGQNRDRTRLWQAMCCQPGRSFAAEEKVRTQCLELPQARQTYAVLGSRSEGIWGYDHGINEHHVAAGWTALRSALPGEDPGLHGTDLVRLALERSRTARQAVQLVGDLIQRYGQSAECDHAVLLADPREAYALETAGRYWVYQEVSEVRVQSTVRVIRQDWDHISPGLADHAIDRGWWPADGSKLDFAGAFKEDARDQSEALSRWGQATILLQEQSGHIDTDFFRRGLATSSLVCRLSQDPATLPMAWCAFGGVHFPLFLEGELPRALTSGSRVIGLDEFRWKAREIFARLQARFDREAEEFVAEAMVLKKQGDRAELQRQATYFMQYNWERFETALDEVMPRQPAIFAETS